MYHLETGVLRGVEEDSCLWMPSLADLAYDATVQQLCRFDSLHKFKLI
jgi:hypothetical protein